MCRQTTGLLDFTEGDACSYQWPFSQRMNFEIGKIKMLYEVGKPCLSYEKHAIVLGFLKHQHGNSFVR